MKRIDPVKIFENRASVKTHSEPECDNCGLPLVFALQAASGESFSLDLKTILECLKIAENDGYIPPLSDEWWNDIRIHFNV